MTIENLRIDRPQLTDDMLDQIMASAELRGFIGTTAGGFYNMNRDGYAVCTGGRQVCYEAFVPQIQVHAKVNAKAKAHLSEALAECQAFWNDRMRSAMAKIKADLGVDVYPEFAIEADGIKLMVATKE